MGQRTMFFTVAEDCKGNMKVCGYYHGWGIGRVMPMAVMTCVFTNERRVYGKTAIDGVTFNASAQGYSLDFSATYEAGDKLARKVWNNPRMIGEFRGDNNNGAVVLYARDRGESVSDGTEYKIGFLLGSEDMYQKYGDKEYNKDNEALGEDFGRWLTLEEWAGMEANMPHTGKTFLSWFKGFMGEFGVVVKAWNN